MCTWFHPSKGWMGFNSHRLSFYLHGEPSASSQTQKRYRRTMESIILRLNRSRYEGFHPILKNCLSTVLPSTSISPKPCMSLAYSTKVRECKCYKSSFCVCVCFSTKNYPSQTEMLSAFQSICTLSGVSWADMSLEDLGFGKRTRGWS